MKANMICSCRTLIAVLFILLSTLLGGGSEALAATGNETCSTATGLGDVALGTLILPHSRTGNLDSTQTPDVDYYRITGATPGSQLGVTVSGIDPGNGVSLIYPEIGVFDSSCMLQTQSGWGYLTAQATVTVPADGIVILAVAGWPDMDFTGGGSGGYRIDIKVRQIIGSISGMVLDGTTNTALPWSAYPSAVLEQCVDATCSSAITIANPWVDSSTGSFIVSTDSMGQPLEAGTYRIVVNASGYETLARVFTAAAGTNVDLGILGVMPLPYIGSISGTFVDQDSLQPLQGQGYLYQCYTVDCSSRNYVAWAWIDAAGHFSISQNWSGQPLPVGTYQIQFDDSNWPQRYDTYWSVPLVIGANENRDLGTMALAHFPYIGSLSGRAVDALTLVPLSGTVDPFAQVELTNCNKLNQCTFGRATADALGHFTVTQDYAGQPLFAGPTTVTLYATQYQPTQVPQLLDLLANENRDLGDLKVNSNPIRFTNITPCANIPSAGGRCRFSVTLVNGQAREVNAMVWSEIDASGVGSFAGNSRFTLGKQTISFGPGTRGASKTVSFVLDVPATVADYAWIQAGAYIADEKALNPWLQPIGSAYLFGMMKVPYATSFTPVTEKEGKELMKKSVEKLDPKPDDKHFHEHGRPPVQMPWEKH